MGHRPGSAPPPAFAQRNLPIELVPAGATFVRIHRKGHASLHFGTSGDNRFDDPERRYGVCYAARTLEGAFAETCLRPAGAALVPLSRLAARVVSLLEVVVELRLVQLHGTGLARMGATAAVSSGGYDISQPCRGRSSRIRLTPTASSIARTTTTANFAWRCSTAAGRASGPTLRRRCWAIADASPPSSTATRSAWAESIDWNPEPAGDA
jgi:hypothetical protein